MSNSRRNWLAYASECVRLAGLAHDESNLTRSEIKNFSDRLRREYRLPQSAWAL